jgi:hypothetical protein
MDEELSVSWRAFWGVLGGAGAVATKFLGQDLYWVQVHLDTREYVRIENLAIIYAIALVGLCFVGAVVAAGSRENNRIKLLAIAVAAPALFTTAAGGASAERTKRFSDLFGVSAAHAQTVKKSEAEATSISLTDGVKQFFGIGRDETRYRVIVGSFKDKTQAAITASRLKTALPELNVYVGERQPTNDYFPVMVGDYLRYPDASALKDKAIELTGIKDTYLSRER